MEKHTCAICKKEFPLSSLMTGSMMNSNIIHQLQKKNPDFNENSFVCLKDLNVCRSEYIKQIIEKDIGEVNQLEKEFIQGLEEQELLSTDLIRSFSTSQTFGDKMADKLAEFGGSWRFIILFTTVLCGWIAFNSLKIMSQPFDPYPYILLNLVLSCLAAIQAPIIMMSQNRQEAKDRLRAESDYKINLKAELEIRHLKSKLDELASHQWRRLLEIQELQTQLMTELTEKASPHGASAK